MLCRSIAAADKNALLGWFINGKWCETIHFLGVVLCHAFSVAWDQVGGVAAVEHCGLSIDTSAILSCYSMWCV